MVRTQLSSSVTLLIGATEDELRAEQFTQRQDYVDRCEKSSECRVPADEDLDRWWPRTKLSRPLLRS